MINFGPGNQTRRENEPTAAAAAEISLCGQ